MDVIQDQIIKLAESLFVQYGIRSVSIDDICKKMSISKKTFYLYFKQKEDLIDSVLTLEETRIVEYFHKLSVGKTALNQLLLYIREAKKMSSTCDRPAMFYDLQKYYAAIYEVHDQKRNNFIRAAFMNNLEQGVAEGDYRSDMDFELISIFFSLHHRNVVEEIKSTSQKFTNKRIIDFFIDMTMRFIVSDKGAMYLKSLTATDVNNENVETSSDLKQ